MSKTVEVRLNFTAETAQAEQALNRLQTSLRNISTQSNMNTGGFRFTQELNQASDAAIKLRQNLSNAINTNTNKLDLSKFRKEMDKSGMSLEKYRVALQKIGPEGQNAFIDLSKAILSSQTPLTHSIKLFDKLWDSLKRTAGWQISSLAIHGIQSALSDAYHYAEDLNKSLNNIRIVTGYSADRMADFAKQANKAARELSSTTLDYTDASLIYYQQGLDDKAVKERTDTTIKMANVTGTTAETVSQQMTAVWENFMKDGQHATEYYADVMAALGASTASSTDEIAQGLEKFAAVADTVGLSYEYATAALATITAKTRQSADIVGTALKTLFARIEGLKLGETLDDGTTLNKYSEALEAVGVNIKDDAGNLKDMDNILDEIGAKWENLSKDQQVALAQAVAGIRQYTQFIALMDNWDFMGENLATAYSAEGTLEKQQKIYEESWEAARNRLQASVETLYDELLKDDFFIWLTNALSDVVGLIDKIISSMGGLTGLLPGLILLMNKLWGDKIINGISNAAYNMAGLIPSVNQKRQEADLATRDQALVQLRALRDYQAGGGRGGEAVNASIKAYEQISKIEETRLRLGKSITSEQAATLDIYREQLEIMEKAAQKQGQAYNDSRKARNEQMNYVKILQAAAENEIRKGSGPIYRAGAGSSWLNRVGANYMPGMDLKQGLPTEGGTAARGILKYVRENSNNSNIQWADIQSYANGDKTAQNYNIVAQAIERLRDKSVEAGVKVQELQKILEFNARSMSSNPNSLQYQAEQVSMLASAQEKLSNIMQRVGSTNDVATLSQLGAEFKKILTTTMAGTETSVEYKKALDDLNSTINNVAATSNDYQKIMQQFIRGGGNVTSISEAMSTANEKLNKTMQDLVVKYNIAPEAVTKLAQAMQAYAKDSSKTAEVVKTLNNAVRQSSVGMSKMSTQIDQTAKIQNIVSGVTNLAFGLSSLTAISDTISNPNLSVWDKFVSILMSASMAMGSFLPILKSAKALYSSLKIAVEAETFAKAASISVDAASAAIKNKEALATIFEEATTNKLGNVQVAQRIKALLNCSATDALTLARNREAVAALQEATATEVLKKALSGFGKVITRFGPLALGLAAVTITIKMIQKQYSALQDKANQAAETAKTVADNYQSMLEAKNAFDSNVTKYDEAKRGIEGLTEGTTEYINAVREANDAALELIKNNHDLKYSVDDNGLINIDKKSLESAQKEKAEKLLQLQSSSQLANIEATNAQNKADRATIARQLKTASDFGVIGLNGLALGASGAMLGAGIAIALAPLTGGLSILTAAIIGGIAGITANTVAMESLGTASEAETNVLSKLIHVTEKQQAELDAAQAQNNVAAFTKTLNELGLEGISTALVNELMNNWTAIEAQIDATQANTAALRAWVQQNGSAINQDNETYQDLSDEDKKLADSITAKYLASEEGQAEINRRKGAFSQSQRNADQYLIDNYGKDALQNYKITNLAGGNVTLMKKNEEGIWETIGDENGLSWDTIKTDLATREVAQFNSNRVGGEKDEQLNLLKQLQSARTAMSGIEGLSSDSINDVLNDVASGNTVDLSSMLLTTDQIDAMRSVANELANDFGSAFNEALNAYTPDQYYQRMYEEGQAILQSTADEYDTTKEALEAYTEDLVENTGELYDNYKAAAQAASSNFKLAKNLENLSKVLDSELDVVKELLKTDKKTSKYYESLGKITQAVSKLFNIKVSPNFVEIPENLQLIEEAANGSQKALQQLGLAISKDYFANLDNLALQGLETGTGDYNDIASKFTHAQNIISNGIDTLQSKLDGLKAGTSLADALGSEEAAQEFIDSLNIMAAQSGISVQEMQDNLSAMSISATVEPKTVDLQTEVPKYRTIERTVSGGDEPGDRVFETYTYQVGTASVTEHKTVADVKYDPKGKGGVKTPVKIAPVGSLGGGGGSKSSGGGGGGGSKKDKKKASNEIERYHVVKQQLDRLSSEYDRLSAAKDRAYGPDKLKAIDKEIAKLQEQEAMQKRYIDEIERYYQQDRAAIAKYGAVFDANGIITNYDALMQKQLDIFNASLTDEAEEAYNVFKEALDQYEETLALKLEESGNLLDKQYEIVSAKLEKITYKVEYKVEIEEDKLDYLERRLTRLSEVEKASLQVFAVNQDKIMSYWIQYATYAEAIKDIEEDINEQKAKGLEITDEQIQKLQDYKNSMGEIEDNIYDLYNDEIDSISDRYSNLFDQLENYQDRIRDYRDSLETIKDMYSLLGVATVEDNRAMNGSIRKTYQAEAKGIQNEINLLKARREELDKSRNSLGKSVDEQGNLIDGIVADIKQLEDVGDLTIMEDSTKAYSQKLQNQIDEVDQQVHEKQMELISLASDYLNAIKDQWINNLELIGQKTKDALYEGLEWAIDKYGDLTDLSELYLSNTRKIYELNKLNRSIQADINKIDNVAAKTKLRDLMKDINGYYADNVKMSEYELKNLQAQYELRLAEIALEDARNAKSEVRLTRDNEGRWGYMYTANTEEVDKAEQELEDKRYELQQLQEDTLKDAGEKILSLQNDYIDAMTELQSSDLSDEQKKKRAEELTSLYQKQLDYYYKTYAQALQASGLAYEETILGQATNTKFLQEVMETFGHASIEMVDQMISETQKYQEAFTQMVSDITGKQINSYEEAQTAWMEYMSNTQKALNEATTQATNNFNEVAKAIQNMSKEFKKLIDELIVYLARLSGEDMSLLFYSALANGDYEMAERYAKARRQKIDSNPDKYGQYDWDINKMNQIIDENQNKDTPMSQEQREALLANAKEPYSAKTDWSLAMRNALSAGEYDKAGQYAEYRAYKVHNDASLKDLAWTEAQLQAEIDRYAQDVSKMSLEQKRRILATASQYDTGGYTGSWGNEGRWALLHEKELVLNKSDTSNLLTAVTLLHDLMARLDQASAWSALRELTPASATTTTEILEQNVHIEASFPNAVDHNEIEQAFENIVNLASQYANRK